MLRLQEKARGSSEVPSINLMPMLDVVFLILIFFLLTSIVTTQPVLNLDLPKSVHASLPNKGKHIQIVIQKSGEIKVNQDRVTLDQLEFALSQSLGGDIKKQLVISADKDASFGHFVGVLDIVKNLNISNLEILTDRKIDSK